MSDILFIDKPKGITSFDVIRRLRRKLGIRKMGHAGTLDPNASGLLIVGIGEGTKRLQEYMALPKTYVMDVLLGVRTDSGDAEGRVIEERPVSSIERGKVEAILREMVGDISLPVPIYSALKHKGKPLYAYARKGIAVEPRIRSMKVHSLRLLKKPCLTSPNYRGLASIVLTMELKCGKGTYARSVGEEIGRRLGVPATLQDLRRTAIGNISVAEAQPPPENL